MLIFPYQEIIYGHISQKKSISRFFDARVSNSVLPPTTNVDKMIFPNIYQKLALFICRRR